MSWNAYLVATPIGNEHRLFGPDRLQAPSEELGKWLSLDRVELQGGQSVWKVARHEHGGRVYTWIALYYEAGELPGNRERGGYVGAGILSCDARLPADAVTSFVAELAAKLAALIVTEGRINRHLHQVSFADLNLSQRLGQLDRTINEEATALLEGRGVSPVGGGRAERYPLVLLDREPDFHLARLIHDAQGAPAFSALDLLYVTDDPTLVRYPPNGGQVVRVSELDLRGFAGLGLRPLPPPSVAAPAPNPSKAEPVDILAGMLRELTQIRIALQSDRAGAFSSAGASGSNAAAGPAPQPAAISSGGWQNLLLWLLLALAIIGFAGVILYVILR